MRVSSGLAATVGLANEGVTGDAEQVILMKYLFNEIFIGSFATCSCIVEFSGRCQ